MSGAGPSRSDAGWSMNVELSPMTADGSVQEGTPAADVVQEPTKTACAKLLSLCKVCFPYVVLVAPLLLFVIVVFAVLTFLLPCNKDLVIQLKGFTVRDMVVVHINSTPWEVTSDIDLTLALQNPNSWARPCDFSLRELELSVRALDSLISFFDFLYELQPLNHASSHTVSTTLTGDRSHVSDEVGVALEAQLLGNDNVTLVLDINARYLLEPGLTRLVNHNICKVVAKTPQQASMKSGVSGFISAECEEKVMEDV